MKLSNFGLAGRVKAVCEKWSNIANLFDSIGRHARQGERTEAAGDPL
jgi:hypothetical protein